MPEFDVIIPWQGDCPYRLLARDWVVAAHESFLSNVIVGELDPDRPWSKAEAVEQALRSSTADHVVISDADVWTGGTESACDMLLDGEAWVVPFDDVHRLSPASTSVALRTGDLGGPLQQRAYRGVPGGGMVAISRDNYERVPLDPRFVGWGQEDEAWGMALEAVLGRGGRVSQPLYHLWHPPQERQNRAVGSDGSRHLRNRYSKAKRIPGGIEALLAEYRSDADLAV